MSSFSFSSLLLILTHLVLFSESANITADQDNNDPGNRLLEYLESKFKKSVMPPAKCIQPSNKTTCIPFTVQSRLFLIRIQDVADSSEVLLTTVRLQLGWNDTRLSWRPDDYGGLKSVVIPGGSIWIPDLQLANSVDDLYVLAKDPSFNFRLSSTGELWWHPTAKVSTRCSLDLLYFPFDYQKCVIVIESVIYQIDELRLMLRAGKTPEEAIPLSMYSPNDQWALVATRGFPVIYRTSNSTAFGRLHYWFLLKRQPEWAQMVFILPIALLSVVQLMTYVLPAHFIDRTAQATVVLLAVAFYEGSITANLPKTSQQSRVFDYLSMVMGMSIATVGVSAVTVALIEPDRGLRAPFCIPSISKRLKRHNSSSRNGNIQAISANGNSSGAETGRLTSKKRVSTAHLIALIINWLAFTAFFLVIIIYPCLTFLEIATLKPPQLPLPPRDDQSPAYYPENF